MKFMNTESPNTEKSEAAELVPMNIGITQIGTDF